MADKFLQIEMNGGEVLPLKIDNVVTIAATSAADVCTVTLTYSNGGTAVLTSVTATASVYVPQSAANLVELKRTLWNIITGSASQPWNQPIYSGSGYAWDNWSVEPASSQASSYYAQDANPAGSSTFAAKQGGILPGRNNAGADGDCTALIWSTIT